MDRRAQAEGTGEVSELRVSYLYTHTYTPLSMYKRDRSWIGIYPKMKGLLTPEILRLRLLHELEINVPESVTEAILAYPDGLNDEKDVTVVFAY